VGDGRPAWRVAVRRGPGLLEAGDRASGVVRRFRDTPENANADPDTLDSVIDGLLERAETVLTKA
jgi:hypothetical protein